MRLGIDIGSTTVKLALIDNKNTLLYSSYDRHNSKVAEKLLECLTEIRALFSDLRHVKVAVTGSAGMGISEQLGINFVQEVFATKIAADTYAPDTDVIIELGGEDAKILFLSRGLEVRMNGTCAGGTGAFVDQIATLLCISPDEMDEQAKLATKTYPIASRCGVFAKSDIQPLLNQGASKADLSLSIFRSVVNQTITGLAQGREIAGNVLYLGGPLTFLSQLRSSFDSALSLTGRCPDNSLHYVSLGTALCADSTADLDVLTIKLKQQQGTCGFDKTDRLFEDEQQYRDFKNRHDANRVERSDKPDYDGEVFVGIDAGSTTIKIVVIDQNERILHSDYKNNGGNPIPPIKDFLNDFYAKHPKAKVRSAAVTGYGEDMIKAAFGIDFGLVETIAHYTAARKFNDKVDFIIDIGGQDIKCFKIANGVIDDIFLNEACSSGCGSFLQSFASVLGYEAEHFAKLGLFADSPVDLGSRCTVFMNSSVKQAQKDGASVENISAGLSISVVKNAIYKVIRATHASQLGENIVVQGGTFLSDAVLRAFEKEIGGQVIRPNIAGIMGAYGAALYGKGRAPKYSTLLDAKALSAFEHKTVDIRCKGCANNCRLTVSTFDGNRRYVAGNRCDLPTRAADDKEERLNLYESKRQMLAQYGDTDRQGTKASIGLPMVLNMYEMLPFWHKLFTSLNFSVKTSGFSAEETYERGQHTIPSDTVCFPAKLVHGHIEQLMAKDIDAIFYPCMSYNIDEGRGDNHYNCPIVAYYPETVANNIPSVKKIDFIYDYLGLHRPKDFAKKMHALLNKHFGGFKLSQVQKAVELAFSEHSDFLRKVRCEAESIVEKARSKGNLIAVLAGRPYHLDSKVNHGIDKLINSYGVAVISEDGISHLTEESHHVAVLNQWTYHSRMYDAAKYIGTQSDMHLVQLVSFGCGVDAITTDEVRSILGRRNKIYTQLKIDEITNLGAAKIRIRSLLAAIEQEGR